MSNETEIKKCEFPHNEQRLVLQQPIKLVKNDPYPCPHCGKILYVTIESAAMNELLDVKIGWYLYISEEKIK